MAPTQIQPCNPINEGQRSLPGGAPPSPAYHRLTARSSGDVIVIKIAVGHISKPINYLLPELGY